MFYDVRQVWNYICCKTKTLVRNKKQRFLYLLLNSRSSNIKKESIEDRYNLPSQVNTTQIDHIFIRSQKNFPAVARRFHVKNVTLTLLRQINVFLD